MMSITLEPNLEFNSAKYLLQKIKSCDEENSKSSSYFYIQLILITYFLAKNVLDQQTHTKSAVISWLKAYTSFIEDQIDINLYKPYSIENHQWKKDSLSYLPFWINSILSTKNHYGTPPFYIYISPISKAFPPLPRIWSDDIWISGFGGRFLVLPGALNLSDSQKAELWNHLLIAENIYGDETINHSSREEIFQALLQLFPHSSNENLEHLDLCGGKGDFLIWLHEHHLPLHSFIIDNADEAVRQAQSKGLEAFVGSAEQPLQVSEPLDIITIIFAIQWLTSGAFTHVLNALKPGGVLLANVYPADPERTEMYSQALEQAGFVEVQQHKVISKTGKDQYILRAKKPEIRPVR